MNIKYLQPVHSIEELPATSDAPSMAYDLTKNDSSFFIFEDGIWLPESLNIAECYKALTQKGSYLHPDGSPDTLEEALESGRCMASALGKLFKPNEGIVVELVYQPKYPDDPYGKYLVYRDGASKMVKTSKLSPEDDLYLYGTGQLVWVSEEHTSTDIVH